jgi:tetratricopeptide (TPR) repeat protein
MFSRHPNEDDFQSFLKGVTRPASSARIVQHLLADCSICHERLQEMGWDDRRLERLLFLVNPDSEGPASIKSGYNYDRAFTRADRAVEAFFSPVQPLERTVEELFSAISALPVEEQLDRVVKDKAFVHPLFIQYLVDRSHAIRYRDPERMVHFARLAMLAVQECAAESAGGELRRADLRARAWSQYGNALRVCGLLKEAEEALARAAREFEGGTGDPLLRARMLEHRSSLQVHQRRFESAIESARAAGQIHRELGDSHMLAAALVLEVHATWMTGETEASLDLLNRAIPLIDCESDPHLLLAACHNLIRCYIDLAQPELALSLYAETRDLYHEFGDPLILLRAGWQEGQLLRDMGHMRMAETRLLEAQKGFLERGLTYEAAVVSLDLAALYLKIGSIQDVQHTAAAAVPIFRALGVDRDAIASLLQLQQVADQEQQAMDLVRFLSARIEPLAKRGLLK